MMTETKKKIQRLQEENKKMDSFLGLLDQAEAKEQSAKIKGSLPKK